MATAKIAFESIQGRIDDLLRDICEELQLSPSRYRQAEERYNAVASFLESTGSPFRHLTPEIYPQGSMRLGTTVKPLNGPHDLDFVCELELSHLQVNPVGLLDAMFDLLHDSRTYCGMVSRKNRCVRITYADEFHMDVLPACRDLQSGGTCIQVPDRDLQAWSPSNPKGYALWFENRCEFLGLRRLREAPIPQRETVEEKKPLKLAVQLIKRWRDLHFKNHELAPASILLTTLAAHFYKGEESVSAALSSILSQTATSIPPGPQRLVVLNPSNSAEDLSERWDEVPEAYSAFTDGIRKFKRDWDALLLSPSTVYRALEELFGEPVQHAIAKEGRRLQEARRNGQLGIKATGLITGVGAAVTPVRPNIFHGKK